MTIETAEQKMRRQLELEQDMIQRGITRYRNAQEKARQSGNDTSMSPVNNLLKACIEPVSKGIREFLEAANTGKSGRRTGAVKHLRGVDPDVAALISCRVILDRIAASATSELEVVLAIGRGIEDEMHLKAFEAEAPKLFKTLAKNVTTHARHRRRVFIHSMNKMQIEWESWSKVDHTKVGMVMLTLFKERTNLIARVHFNQKGKTRYQIQATEETLSYLQDKHARAELLSPSYLPTIIPPKPWTGMFSGGYHSNLQTLPMVKGRGNNSNTLEDLRNHFDDMKPLVDGLNTIQATPWCINKPILEVLTELWDQGHEVAGLPQRNDFPLPARVVPQDLKKEDMTEFQREQFKAWGVKASRVYEKNKKLASKRLQMAAGLAVAEQFVDESEIFFPHQVDFRSRAYPTPLFLTPQGDDRQKALLTLAEGKTLDGVALGWLYIHAANVWGEDKVSFDDRIEWTEKNLPLILNAAADPLNTEYDWWMSADKPFQFLAVCFEIAGFHADPTNFISTLPVALDGACNGLQHYSAALRDERGGKAVCLTPADKPSDIYGLVAEVATDFLRLDSCEGVTFAAEWLQWGIDRKTTKRSVMIVPYSGTLYSCQTYIKEYAMDRMDKDPASCPFAVDDIQAACNYLAGIVWKSIKEEVLAAREGMEWLSASARKVAKMGVPVSWRSPVGFPVIQTYKETKTTQVKTKFGDVIQKFILREDTNEFDVQRHSQSVAPNFTHANDAAHMYLSVNKAKEYGVEHFAMIHDSYGSCAGNIEVLFQALRAAFVEMYLEHDVFADFKTSMEEVLDEELPPPPAMGSLDIMQVLDSEFFFA